jgi:imidazolonepropionase-like amidohydrolase
VTVVTTPDEARRVVDTVKDGGAAAVKIHGRVPHDAYVALLARARERQIPVVGHLPASVTVREAIAAGQHSIDHVNNIADGCASEAIEAEVMRLRELRPAPQNVQQMIIDGYDQQRCEDLMRRLRDAGVWLVPTLVESRARLLQSDPVRTSRDELKYVPKSEREVWDAARPNARAQALADTRQRVYQQGQKLVGLLQRSGVPLMTGTDVSNPWLVPGFSVHDELALFVESGMTPAEALRAATLAPARFLGKTDTLGTAAAGKLADLVLLDADPLADIRNTLKIRAVVAGGRLVDRAALDQLLAGLAQQ